jgi:DNA-binding transcriptional ArsR family regulator
VSPRSQARQSGVITTKVAERVADTMFALSTPSRVQILGCLIAGSHTVSDLTEALGMEQSAVSHQLRVLREHRLVTVERDGRTRVYALYDEDVVALVEGALRHVERRDTPGKRLPRRMKRSSG